MTGILKIVTTTDFGADCDDQKAVSDGIEALAPGEEMAFIVSGPHPALAGAAIAEKYFLKTGHYPLIGLGKQFEDDKRPENQIYSLVDGAPMVDKTIPATFLSPEDFQRAVDAQIRAGSVKTLEAVVLAPLHSPLEYYNPTREELQDDHAFHEKWARVTKTSTTQFQRTDDGHYKGNNYLKSGPGVADGFLRMLQDQGVEALFFDGAVAKLPEFLMCVEQANHPGLQRSFEAYIATMQVPWLYMTGANGETPSADIMHAGMFTAGASFPFGVHVANGTPAGFGLDRALKEICAITPQDTEKYAAAKKPLTNELEAFDLQVLKKLRETNPEIATVADMRAEMHRGMMDALQRFAQRTGVCAEGETVASFTDLFARAKQNGVKLNPYNYMEPFTEELYHASPVTKAVTEIAAIEINTPRADGKSHTATLASALAEQGARATVYDAVAVAAGIAVRSSPELKNWFAETTPEGQVILNITQTRVEKLKNSDSRLYATLRDGVTRILAADGSALAGMSAPKAAANASQPKP